MKTQRGDHLSGDGFTLMELVIVILIIGILTAVAIPRLTSTSSMSARLAADLVAADIRGVQAAAMSGGAGRSITFTSQTSSYTAGGLMPEHRSLPKGATVDYSPFFQLTFNTLGEPAKFNDQTLERGSSIPNLPIKVGEDSVSLSIEPLTGKVRIN